MTVLSTFLEYVSVEKFSTQMSAENCTLPHPSRKNNNDMSYLSLNQSRIVELVQYFH